MTAPPLDLRPMKAVSGDLPPPGEAGWVYEVKWDGMRVLAYVVDGDVRLVSTNGIDATARFPEVDGIGATIGCDAVLDGELVSLDETGRPDFGRLQHRMHLSSPADARRRAAEDPVSFAVFDLLWLDGHATLELPWTERRRLLQEIVAPTPAWRVSAAHDDGRSLLDVVIDRGLEGVMAKRSDSPYLPGKRSPAWRKVKVRRRQEFVVGGWWPGEGNRAGGLGSLLVGVHDPAAPGNPLRYSGRVGSGLTGADLRRYEQLLGPLATPDCPFDPPPPRPVSRIAHWVRPEIVVEVAFGEWTAEGILRHPSHVAQRVDKDAHDVVRE